MKLLAAFVLALACSPCQAYDKLSESDLVGSGALLATYYVDYRQTLDIKNHPGMYETNPLIGKHPSDGDVKRYFVKASVLSLATVYVLPKEYRKYFIGGAITIELAVIGHNKHIGMRTNF